VSLGWIWTMPDKESAARAIKVGVFVCSVLALANFALASLLEKGAWRDYDPSLRWVAWENAAVYVLVGWRLRQHSRTAAVIGLIVTLYFYRDKLAYFPAAILPSLAVLALINSVRATILFRRYEAAEKQDLPEVTAP
jgi:hypothetical protein